MDLVEFLLARIAEDEVPSWSLHPYECEPGCCAPAGWVGAQCRYCDLTPVYGGTVKAMTWSAEEHAELIHRRSRVLAHCGAVRRIVETYTDMESLGGNERLEQRLTLRFAMESLALPYADHPDYDSAWSPEITSER